MISEFPLRSRRLRLGFVGGGLIGPVHANGARLSNCWDVVAGALSSDADRATARGRDWGLAEQRCYSDWQEMARAEAGREDGIDAVAIVTPNHLHAPVAHAFLDAGIDVISDKPVSISSQEAESLAARARETGLVYGVTHPYASHSMVRQARAMIREGQIGEVRQVHVEYFQGFAMELGESDMLWRLDPQKSGPSFTVADIGTHAIHLAEFVVGRPLAALRAELLVAGADKPLEDSAFMHLRFEDELPGTLMVSQALVGYDCALNLRVGGTRASLEWHQETPESLMVRPIDGPRQVLTRGQGAGILPEVERLLRMPRGHPEALTDAWANLYLEFALAIEARREGREPDSALAYPDIEDGLRGMRFVEAAVRSRDSGEWATL